jgi:multiple sugar transport system permease protein
LTSPKVGPLAIRLRLPKALRRGQVRMAYLCLVPAMFFLILFSYLPVVGALVLSFTDYNFSVEQGPNWIGLSNYRDIVGSDLFWQASWNTVYFTFFTNPIQIALGLLLALAMNQGVRGISFYRLAYYLPTLTSMVAVSLAFSFLFDVSGIFNFVLVQLGVPPQTWLQDPTLAMPSIIGMTVWKYVGYTMLIYLAGLQGIPDMYYQAAKIDGANSWQLFRNITLPLVKPITVFLVITYFISSLQMFEQAYILTAGGPVHATTTIVYQIYITAFTQLRLGYAAAIAFILFAVIFVLTIINVRLLLSDELQY